MDLLSHTSTPPLHQIFSTLSAHGPDALSASSRAMIAHLQGTYDRLVCCGARPALATAGLISSLYSQESYPHQAPPPGLRHRARERVGSESERIAYMFGMMDREEFYGQFASGLPSYFRIEERFTHVTCRLEPRDYADLCNLIVADWLERRDHVPTAYKFLRTRELRAMCPFLLPLIRQELQEAYALQWRE